MIEPTAVALLMYFPHVPCESETDRRPARERQQRRPDAERRGRSEAEWLVHTRAITARPTVSRARRRYGQIPRRHRAGEGPARGQRVGEAVAEIEPSRMNALPPPIIGQGHAP